MGVPVIELTDGDVFAYLNVQNVIVIWVRENGSWRASDREMRATDADIRETLAAVPVEERLGGGKVRVTHYAGTTGDLLSWTLLTGSEPGSGTPGQRRTFTAGWDHRTPDQKEI